MTEHAAVVFVFFFLAEYSSLVIMCILTSLLFLGGYLPLFGLSDFFPIIDYVCSSLFFEYWYLDGNRFYMLNLLFNTDNHSSLWEGFIYGLTLGIKSSILIFTFVWARASFPRIRFDQLMSFCWTVLLPIIFAFIILIPCILYSLDIFPAAANITLLGGCLPLLVINRNKENFQDNIEKMSDSEFNQWFAGFVDASTCADYFSITSKTINDKFLNKLPSIFAAHNSEFKLSRRLLYSEGNSYSNQIRLLFEEEELNQHSPRRVSILKSGIVDISLLNNFDLSLSGVMLYLQLILLPCILYSLDIFPININLF